MSILPAYLCSFSSVAPCHRGVAEHTEIDRINHHENAAQSGKAQKSASENDERAKRLACALVVRSGGIVTNYGDVFSLSQNGRPGAKTTQDLYIKGDTAEKLTAEEKQQVSELKQRDAEVKAHEAAHMSAAGGLVRGGASYEYQKGPDGRDYAVGGEVSIDSSPVTGDPNASIAKAQQIRSAALAPRNPSSQDHKVATKASRMEDEARQELSKNEQNPQNLSTATISQTVGDKEISRGNPQSHNVSNTAVTKYVSQSSVAPSEMQSIFSIFA